jgi:hypothetical protein
LVKACAGADKPFKAKTPAKADATTLLNEISLIIKNYY